MILNPIEYCMLDMIRHSKPAGVAVTIYNE
jgi:hypothetical protein